MRLIGFVILAGIFGVMLVAASPQSIEGQENAEIKHQKLMSERIQKTSLQETAIYVLDDNEDLRTVFAEMIRIEFHEDPELQYGMHDKYEWLIR